MIPQSRPPSSACGSWRCTARHLAVRLRQGGFGWEEHDLPLQRGSCRADEDARKSWLTPQRGVAGDDEGYTHHRKRRDAPDETHGKGEQRYKCYTGSQTESCEAGPDPIS